ncbi:MAG: sulfotransferase [Chloroflexi bacterium]|nr:sulfotransferase [Chloroflexota bacterium]
MEKIKVVYIAGYGRSGSTLLERILAQLDMFVSVGELRHMWQRSVVENQLCGCNRPFGECPFWQPIMKEVFTTSAPYSIEDILSLKHQTDRIRFIPKMLFPRKSCSTKTYLNILRTLYRVIHEHSGGRVILESSKDISTLYLLSQIEEIDLYVIHLVRDSRAVAYSWQRKKLRPEITTQKTYMPTISPGTVAIEWLARNFLVEMARPLVKGYRLIRYEDLVTNPESVIEDIFDMLNETSANLSFITASGIQLDKVSHSVAGNPMRFQQGHIQVKADEEWRDSMQRKQKWFISFVSLLGLIRYGYLS